MRRSKQLFTLVTLFIVVVLFLSTNQGTKQTSMPPSTPTPTPGNVLSETTGSTCQAIHVNESDPQAYLPDHNCTPGVTDPAVTQENIDATICKSGYTQTVRPAVVYTNALKKQQITEYGFSDTNMTDYEEDHFISLELGGSPKDPKNLWPEPHPSTNEKDLVENYLHKEVCDGVITLVEAQQSIANNWYDVYKQIQFSDK